MQGNEALFRGAVAAGARFYAGYPITPSSEIAELAASELPRIGGVYVQMEDELASIAAVIGAALSGRPSFTATSGPGFSLMQENLGVAYMAEVPCVVINVMRSGPSTGLATMPAQADVMQARWGTHGDHPALAFCPATVQECYELSALAMVWAEQLRMPVTVLADQVIGHLREPVTVPEHVPQAGRPALDTDAESYRTYASEHGAVPPLATFGDRHLVRVNSSMHDERGLPTTDRAKARALLRRLHDKPQRTDVVLFNTWHLDDAEWLFISYGISARTTLESVNRLRARGVSAGFLQLKTIWPFPSQLIARMAAGRRGLFVVELNLGQLVHEVQAAACREAPVFLIGESDGRPLLPGEIIARYEEAVR
jgi:2-oxoglutarate ferredoxin oxidoreductase subunit alpha